MSVRLPPARGRGRLPARPSLAVSFSDYGPPEVLQLNEIQDAQLGVAEVRVRTQAVGLQPFDYKWRNGSLRELMSTTFPQRLGMEFSGTVEEVGDEVTDRAVGDKVMGWMTRAGAHAELLTVPAANTIVKPPNLGWETAGAISSGGQTADTVLEKLHVGPDDTLLVHAAAGGVGTFAVQLARVRGADVIGTGSPGNHDYIRSLGATPVAYGDGLTTRLRELRSPVTAVLDAAGTHEAIASSVDVVSDPTRIMTVARLPTETLPKGVSWATTARTRARLERLAHLAATGRLTIMTHAYPLADVVTAHRIAEAGHLRGRIILCPGAKGRCP